MKEKVKNPHQRKDSFIKANTGKELLIGSFVEDIWGEIGKVVEINKWDSEPSSIENHGMVTVKRIQIREEKLLYQDEEHYVWLNWQKSLKILD